MDITITGKHFFVTDSLKDYFRKKISKVEKNFNQLNDAHAVLTVEKLDHFAEVTINGDSVVFHAEVRTDDMYASIDNLFEKMEKQIRRYKEKHSRHRVKPLKLMPTAEKDSEEEMPIQIFEAENKPMLTTEAILQLESNDYRFLLFKKGLQSVETPKEFKKHDYAIIYRRKDGNYSEVNLVNGTFMLHIYSFELKDDLPGKIKEIETKDFQLNRFSHPDAAITIDRLKADYYIFQNIDDEQLNIIFKLANGDLAVTVPPS